MRNFIIVGTQRTGSTALFRSLNFHPEIACGGEWVHELPTSKKLMAAQRALDGDFSMLTSRNRELIVKELNENTQWLGFKVLFRSSNKWVLHPRLSPALWLDRLEDFIQWLSQRSDVYVIHVVRTDPIEWLKSRYLAGKTGLFAAAPYPDGAKVKIPLRPAVKRLRAKDWIDSRLSTLAGNNPYLRVRYEDFLRSNREVIVSMLEFLECDPSQLGEFDYKKLKKQSKASAESYISNYGELIAKLRHEAMDQPPSPSQD